MPIYSGTLFFLSTTTASVAVVGVKPLSINEHTQLFSSLRNDDSYAAKMSRLDPALGATYQAVNEVVYGTTHDPARGGLFLLREAFNQLFSIIAPDDEVRNSAF